MTNGFPLSVNASVLGAVGADYVKRKAAIDDAVKTRIVQWAKATGAATDTGTPLPYAASYIQNWSIEDGGLIVYWSEQNYLQFEKTVIPLSLLDNKLFVEYVGQCYRQRASSEQAKFDSLWRQLRDDEQKLKQEAIDL